MLLCRLYTLASVKSAISNIVILQQIRGKTYFEGIYFETGNLFLTGMKNTAEKITFTFFYGLIVNRLAPV